MSAINIFWFRRDLRLNDNTGLYEALRSGLPVMPVFIFDTNILVKLDNKADRRVEFIQQTLQEMQEVLFKIGSGLRVFFETPAGAFNQLLGEYEINAVYTNVDYEPYATERDD